MKSKTRLDSAVFQLTPTRTRCDLYIIANDKKEKIASGLLNPFIAHLKTAQDQIAEGGYSVLLAPEAGSNATWFTKCTVESFVRFVSTPEILERVYTIESEILQIEEAIAVQGNNDILIEDQHIHVASSEGNKPAYDADEDKAIVLYKPGDHETTRSSAKEENSKVQLLNVLETRKTVLKKEQGMAFARAVAAGFEVDHVANLLSFAECFGASRLMSACLRFMDLWKQKHESGQWVKIEAEEALFIKSDYSDMNASGVVLSSMADRHDEARTDYVSENKETTCSDPNAGEQQQYHTGQFPHPSFPPWPMHSSPGSIPVYQPYPIPYYQHYPVNGLFYPPPPYPSSTDDSHFRAKDSGHSGKKKSDKVVIRNINFINSKNQNSSGDESASDTDKKTKSNRKESEFETRNGKVTDSGHWEAFQTYLLKGAEGGDRRSADAEHDNNERNGRKIIYTSGNDDFMLGGRERENEKDPQVDHGFEGTIVNLDTNGLHHHVTDNEAVMISLRSTSTVNDYRSNINMDNYNLPSQNQENKVKYEPDDLSLIPERGLEKRSIGYDPALDYEMQLVEDAREKKKKIEIKKGPKIAEKHSKPKQGNLDKKYLGKGKPLKVNSTVEDARAEKLRSYKAELQKMKKEQQEAEHKRLEALKTERQKRIAARANSNRQSLPSKLSPMSNTRSTKFTDSEPGSSSPLQRSKIRPNSITTTANPNKLSTTKLSNGTANRLTRSMSSMSDTKKKEFNNTVVTPDSKASMTRIRRLSEPKNINNTRITKTRSAEPVSKSKLSKNLELKIRNSKVANGLLCQSDTTDDKGVIEKSVVVHEHKQPSMISVNASTLIKEFDGSRETGEDIREVSLTGLTGEMVDKGTVSVQSQKHFTSCQVEALGDNPGYEAPYARVSSFEDPSTRNSEYAKASHANFGSVSGTEKAFISDFNNLKLAKIPEILDKPQPKGFRRLLKLGKKSQTPEIASKPDNGLVATEVNSLKNLISEDQTPTHAHTSQKSSRHFSLLSSFRMKPTEKKPTS